MSSIRWFSLIALAVLIAGPVTFTLAQDAPATQPSPSPSTQLSSTQPSGSLTVTVTDQDGKPVQGASVTVSVSRGRRSGAKAGARPTTRPSPIARGKTNSDGIVVLDNIPSGRLNVSAHLGDSRGRTRIEVKDGEPSTVTIQLTDAAGN